MSLARSAPVCDRGPPQPSVTRTVIQRLAGQPAPDAAAETRLDELTARERDVLEVDRPRALEQRDRHGRSVIEESTVKTHVRHILRKLRLRDRVQAVIFGYESGLIRP